MVIYPKLIEPGMKITPGQAAEIIEVHTVSRKYISGKLKLVVINDWLELKPDDMVKVHLPEQPRKPSARQREFLHVLQEWLQSEIEFYNMCQILSQDKNGQYQARKAQAKDTLTKIETLQQADK